MKRHHVLYKIKNIEDICSFGVNTINIVIELNKISIFLRVRSTSVNLNVFHYTKRKYLWYLRKKNNNKISFYFIVSML